MLNLTNCIRLTTRSVQTHPAPTPVFLLLAALLFPTPLAAEVHPSLVIGNDRGGYLHDRLIELENLERNGVAVEIRGRVCFSTCTMFLGLPRTCVNPNTTFGFHGPSKNGRRLAPEDFDYFSRVMAKYYPEPLKSWFLKKGRNRISGVYRIKGTQIIQMGVRACREA